MANRTTNYGFIKPTKAESANVDIINANMESIDDILHDTQISLAPAYDQNETYNTGDKVQYELLMYKCKADGVTGAWDSTKWERTTAVEGSGGSVDFDIYGEASGTAEASFIDGAEASLVECEIGIVPTQDLHGYSKPWAGGAGKNKFDGEYPEIGNIIKYRPIPIANGTYTMSTNLPLNGGAANIFFFAGSVSEGASTQDNGVSEGISRTVTVTDGYITVAYRILNGEQAYNPENFIIHKLRVEVPLQPTSHTPTYAQSAVTRT